MIHRNKYRWRKSNQCPIIIPKNPMPRNAQLANELAMDIKEGSPKQCRTRIHANTQNWINK